ncbi:PP2C family serine/threonine-protein phosphatase [Limnoraphis robusta]|uniref:PP2C family serine/threonine-protein phosphatase n=1 Tax=Limnoraphis robusta CCNP1315 TaxID=3110306 RepID=A0ABU5TRP1_9CYAN|nr:PP2C family serine/threonine-protein phosphatase [Limnoraphis robusta]MEA5517582.1 PP2C family serine/threonine-protein phosphatase [Limnoraphis robusta CCNP1315]MEA5544616.1 PP2C family serine/threonine-protein phosphatase [Limnoraphis robusta CCNP1324]
MQWQAIGCSEIGSGHIKTGIPCQDFCDHQIISNNQVTIGAVSDGMGSAAHSDLGSKIAVQTTLNCLNQRDWLNHSIDDSQAQVFFEELLKTVVTEIQTVAKREGYSVRDMACTLLAFIATPNLLVAMQCGDGLIVIRPQSSQNYQLLFQPQKGEYANEYVPITSSSAHQYMQVKVIHEPIYFICAATDGIEHISLIKSKEWKAYDKFFEPVETQIMRSHKTESEKEKIVSDWLKSDDINQRTDDDKTVLLCIQNGKSSNFSSGHIQSSNIQQNPSHSAISQSPSKSTEPIESFEEDSLNSKPSNIIHPEFHKIKEDIYKLTNKQYPNIELKLKIKKRILEIFVRSDQEVNKKKFIDLLEPIDFNDYELPIKEVNIFNHKDNRNSEYWQYKSSLYSMQPWVKRMLYIIILAILMTLISLLISILSNGLLTKIFMYFLYSLILIITVDIYVNQSR